MPKGGPAATCANDMPCFRRSGARRKTLVNVAINHASSFPQAFGGPGVDSKFGARREGNRSRFASCWRSYLDDAGDRITRPSQQARTLDLQPGHGDLRAGNKCVDVA